MLALEKIFTSRETRSNFQKMCMYVVIIFLIIYHARCFIQINFCCAVACYERSSTRSRVFDSLLRPLLLFTARYSTGAANDVALRSFDTTYTGGVQFRKGPYYRRPTLSRFCRIEVLRYNIYKGSTISPRSISPFIRLVTGVYRSGARYIILAAISRRAPLRIHEIKNVRAKRCTTTSLYSMLQYGRC